MRIDLMSSEHGESSDDEDAQQLEWRSGELTDIFRQLDKKYESSQTRAGRRQQKQRVHKGVSKRKSHELPASLGWAIKKKHSCRYILWCCVVFCEQ